RRPGSPRSSSAAATSAAGSAAGTTTPPPLRSTTRAARFSLPTEASCGRPAQRYVSTFDGTENPAAVGSSSVSSTSAEASTSGRRSYGWYGRSLNAGTSAVRAASQSAPGPSETTTTSASRRPAQRASSSSSDGSCLSPSVPE